METFYCVTTSFDNRGRVTAGITDSIQAERQPTNTSKETRAKDIYNDWFPSLKAAQDFVKEAKTA